ncbi:unnamed protein product [Sphacelaria rigidula]
MSSILVGAASISLTCRPTGERKPNSGCPTLFSSATKPKNSFSEDSFWIEAIASCPTICPAAAVIMSMVEHLSSAIPASAISASFLLPSAPPATTVSPRVCADPMASRVWLLVCPALGVVNSSAHARRRCSVLRS